jgi:multidrug transporter EmrE-like cation transporter|tara:strand:- start:309 stop:671 length:363 start_codon:yes stop_codon:yes gene_type:complete
MATKLWAMGLVLSCTLLTTTAQVIYKFGVRPFNIYLILLGLGFYGVAAVILLKALKGGELSVLYPIISTSYIWVSLVSPMFFPTDSMNLMKWGGITLIVIGISFIGIGSQKSGLPHAEVV